VQPDTSCFKDTGLLMTSRDFVLVDKVCLPLTVYSYLFKTRIYNINEINALGCQTYLRTPVVTDARPQLGDITHIYCAL